MKDGQMTYDDYVVYDKMLTTKYLELEENYAELKKKYEDLENQLKAQQRVNCNLQNNFWQETQTQKMKQKIADLTKEVKDLKILRDRLMCQNEAYRVESKQPKIKRIIKILFNK